MMGPQSSVRARRRTQVFLRQSSVLSTWLLPFPVSPATDAFSTGCALDLGFIMDRGAWWAVVHGVAKSQTQLRDFTFTFFMHWRRKWQPIPGFLPGESQGQEAWWAAVYRVDQSQTRLKRHSSSSGSMVDWDSPNTEDPIIADPDL